MKNLSRTYNEIYYIEEVQRSKKKEKNNIPCSNSNRNNNALQKNYECHIKTRYYVLVGLDKLSK